MRLINTRTRQLEEFGENPPPYSILSHTWGTEEVSFQEYIWICEHERELAEDPEAFSDLSPRQLHRLMAKVEAIRSKAGFAKIKDCIDLLQIESSHPSVEDVLRRKSHLWLDSVTPFYPQIFHYLWVDTCCIDKISSAELSEAINSMYGWYQRPQICIVHLSDISKEGNFGLKRKLENSRWFTRGWTLQEFLAPTDLLFFDHKWKFITTQGRSTLSTSKGWNGSRTLAAKMAWAAGRSTTRTEDVAYSLLGLFDVNLSLLYGEGARAFKRLQQQILTQTQDFTLLAWGYCMSLMDHTGRGLLATSPRDYQCCENLKMLANKDGEAELSSFQMTNRGLQVSLDVCHIAATEWTAEAWYALLPCTDEDRFSADNNRFSAFTQLALIVRPNRTYVKAVQTPITMERIGVVPVDGSMNEPLYDTRRLVPRRSNLYDNRRPMFLTQARCRSEIQIWFNFEYDKNLGLACTEIYPPPDGFFELSQLYPSRHGFSIPITNRKTLSIFAIRPSNLKDTGSYETEGVVIAICIEIFGKELMSFKDLALNLFQIIPINVALNSRRSLADLFLNHRVCLDPDYWFGEKLDYLTSFQVDRSALINKYIRIDYREITIDLHGLWQHNLTG